ncbi:MAG: histidinol-phosphate aminotransferase family protein [Armatimonadetes bacterium]|nr:histidinol-phosphate aminotransferase family protein [Armatimonadota bacterium]
MTTTGAPSKMPDRGVACVRPEIRNLHAYGLVTQAVPAGKPVRLHQNEAPDDWPEDLKREIANRLATLPWHRYPAARADAVCAALGRMQGTPPEMVAATAGSNEALGAAFAAFAAGGTVVMTSPTYSMAAILAVASGARVAQVPLGPGFELDAGAVLRAARAHRAGAIYLASPNNPTGNALAPDAVAAVMDDAPCAVVLDEAYWEFAKTSWLESVHAHPHLLVVRTFSKALAGAGLRVGWITAQAPLVAELLKVLPPYNVNVFAQVAVPVLAARRDVAASRVRAIVAERDRIGRALLAMGARVYPSETNFLLFEPGRPPGEVHRGLAGLGILVRDVSAAPGLAACLRVSIGTRADNDRFLGALADVLKGGP